MKDFLVIGNMNAVTYKQVFPLIKDGQVRLGANSNNKDFVKPDGTLQAIIAWWYTTLHHDHVNPPMPLTKHYNPTDYPKYDNYAAIEVSRTEDIPCDYYGVMGVPKNFLEKYCPEQFEIVGACEKWCRMATKIYGRNKMVRKDGSEAIVKVLNSGPNIRLAKPPSGKTYHVYEGVILKQIFSRILIRRK